MEAEFRNPNLWDLGVQLEWWLVLLVRGVGLLCMFIFGWVCSRNAVRWIERHGRRGKEVQWSDEALEQCKDTGKES